MTATTTLANPPSAPPKAPALLTPNEVEDVESGVAWDAVFDTELTIVDEVIGWLCVDTKDACD